VDGGIESVQVLALVLSHDLQFSQGLLGAAQVCLTRVGQDQGLGMLESEVQQLGASLKC
jgi:hypothetical protein